MTTIGTQWPLPAQSLLFQRRPFLYTCVCMVCRYVYIIIYIYKISALYLLQRCTVFCIYKYVVQQKYQYQCSYSYFRVRFSIGTSTTWYIHAQNSIAMGHAYCVNTSIHTLHCLALHDIPVQSIRFCSKKYKTIQYNAIQYNTILHIVHIIHIITSNLIIYTYV